MKSNVFSFFDPNISLRMAKRAYDELEYDKAQTQFERVLVEDPHNFEAHFYLAAIYEIKGEINLAIEEFELLTRLKPDDTELKDFLLDMYFKTERYLDAFPLLKRLTRIYPKESRYWVRLSDIVFIHRKYRMALRILLSLPKDEQQKQHIRFKVMLVYRELKQFEQALEIGLELIDENGTNPVYHYFMGTIYQALHDASASHTSFRTAFRLIEKAGNERNELHYDIRQRLLEINAETQFLAAPSSEVQI